MWEAVEIPPLRSLERMLGFSLPVDNQIAIVAYEGIYVIRLLDPSEVEFDGRYPEGGDVYDWEHQVLEYRGARFEMLGLYGGKPLLMGESHERLVLNLGDETLAVQDSDGKTGFEFRFRDLSGDWAYATFSRDFRYILLGMPYALRVFRKSTRQPG
jgi:hypothetical protein